MPSVPVNFNLKSSCTFMRKSNMSVLVFIPYKEHIYLTLNLPDHVHLSPQSSAPLRMIHVLLTITVLVAAATDTTPIPASECSTLPIQCCEQIESASSTAINPCLIEPIEPCFDPMNDSIIGIECTPIPVSN